MPGQPLLDHLQGWGLQNWLPAAVPVSVPEDFAWERQERDCDCVHVRMRACILHVLTRTSWGQLGCAVLCKQEDYFSTSCWMNTIQKYWVGETRFLLLPAMLQTAPGAAPALSAATLASASQCQHPGFTEK